MVGIAASRTSAPLPIGSLPITERPTNDELRCPVLLMWTRHNPGLTEEHAREALKCIPDGRMSVHPNSARWPQWEETGTYDKVHVDFLK